MIQLENNLEQPVKEIMTAQVLTAKTTDRMIDVKQTMIKNHIRHLPVLKGSELVGIISLTDIQRLSFGNTFGENELDMDDAVTNSFSAEMIMHDDPETVDVKTSVRKVAEILTEREYHALPVTEGTNLVGIITTTDLIRFMIRE